jgi:ABC-2 type transport system permease protein
MKVQIWFAFFTALLIGPGLVAKDLVNNSLPLYLSRPFSRSEYVLGKITILAFLLSCMTWISGLGLFLLQGNFEGIGWMMDHLDIAAGVFIGSWLWIIPVSLLALALSAWVKWRPVAAFLMLMVMITGSFFGLISNALFKIQWAGMVNPALAIDAVWRGLFGIPFDGGVPSSLGWLALLGLSVASLFLLHLKLRAYEVVS